MQVRKYNLIARRIMYSVSQKTSPMFLAITRESIDGFSYLAEILLRK